MLDTGLESASVHFGHLNLLVVFSVDKVVESLVAVTTNVCLFLLKDDLAFDLEFAKEFQLEGLRRFRHRICPLSSF